MTEAAGVAVCRQVDDDIDNTDLYGLVFIATRRFGEKTHMKISTLEVTLAVSVASTHQAREREPLGRFDASHDKIC